MKVEATPLSGLLILTPTRYSDDRGYFCESWNFQKLNDRGIDIKFVQDNYSLSRQAGTLRGLHFQCPPRAQDKLVRCSRGALFDVAVDIRKGSPTFGVWFGIELSEENGKQLLVPKGFLHGFVTRAPNTEVCYKCSDYYSPDCDRAVRFDDSNIGINWGLNSTPVMSGKDAAAPFLNDFDSPFVWEG